MRNVNNGKDNANNISTNNNDKSNLDLVCIACERGYKMFPAQDNSSNKIPFQIYKCEEISKCPES